MEYLIKDENLQLIHEPGKGAWTYHIQIPNTKHIKGKWGTLQVAGYIDGYKIEKINLFSRKGQDKLISINQAIRKSIGKTGGDTVIVTLYWLTPKQRITEKDILEAFATSNVLDTYKAIPIVERQKLLERILSLADDEQQIKQLASCIDQLSSM